MSKSPSKMIVIQLLGSFRAKVEPSGQSIDFKSKKARALLSYIAMQDDFSASREKISNLLWERVIAAEGVRNDGEEILFEKAADTLIQLRMLVGSSSD